MGAVHGAHGVGPQESPRTREGLSKKTPLGWSRRLIRPTVRPGAQLAGLGDATQVQGFSFATATSEVIAGSEVLAGGRCSGGWIEYILGKMIARYS